MSSQELNESALTGTSPTHSGHPGSAEPADWANVTDEVEPEPEEELEPTGASSGEGLKIPLNSVLKLLPSEFFKRGRQGGSVRGHYFLPKEVAMDQLATGSVKISFRDLRDSVPAGLLIETDDKDEEMVSLPLREVLKRMKGETFARREDQTIVSVPDTVADVFGPKGKADDSVRILDKSELKSKSANAAPQDPPDSQVSEPPGQHFSAAGSAYRPGHTQPPAPTPPAHVPMPPPQSPLTPPQAPPPQAPQSPSEPPVIAASDALKQAMIQSAGFKRVPGQSPSSPLQPPQGARPGLPGQTQPPTVPAPATTPHAPAQQSPNPGTKTGAVSIPVSQISSSWPDVVRQEIAQFNLESARCNIPVTELEAGMKLGKVLHPWQKIRFWLEPSPPSNFVSTQDNAIIEIPLQAIIPEFLKAKGSAGTPGAALPPTEIPDIFEHGKTAFPARPRPTPAPGTPKTAPTPAASSVPLPPQAPVKPVTPQAPVMPTSPTPRTASQPQGGLASKPQPNPQPQAHPPAGDTADAGFIQDEVFVISVDTVSANWPSPILKEIEGYNLSDANLHIPLSTLEAGLATGKIAHCWNEICEWLQGFPGSTEAVPHGNTRLEIPLHVIAPTFFKQRRAGTTKKAYVPEDIPELFANGSAPPASPEPEAPTASPEPPSTAHTAPPPPAPGSREASAGPGAGPLFTPAGAPGGEEPTTATPQAPRKRPTNIAELFGTPDKKNWTPNEIVNKTAELGGVAGALIALQDGLLVAACMPPEWKTETVAAFLPQMFGRMSQYARELNVGDLSSLTINVKKGPLQIFNAGLIYFAVLGTNNESMPTTDLTIIANELSRHTK